MSSAEDYFRTLRTPRDQIALKFGVDLSMLGSDLFTEDAGLGPLAAIVKLLVDKGVLLDLDVQAALTDAATGADGSVWRDLVTPPSGATFDTFGDYNSPHGEGFEAPNNGDTVTELNTAFRVGQVGTSMLPSLGTITCDSSVHSGGAKSAKTSTTDGYSRALRTDTYADAPTVYTRYYFKAAAAPPTGLCRISSFQKDPASGTDPTAALRADIAIDAAGKPTMFDNGTQRAPGGGVASSICTGALHRVEFGLYGATMEARFFLDPHNQNTIPDFSWTAAYASGAMNSALVGQPLSTLTSGQSWDVWHDDVEFSTSGWVGP